MNRNGKHDISIRGETYAKVREKAKELGVSVPALIERWIEEKLDGEEPVVPPANLLL